MGDTNTTLPNDSVLKGAIAHVFDIPTVKKAGKKV